MKIILIGYMASGKTTIGRLISESLEMPFYDLDTIIEQELKATINEIFEQKGELFFRKKEREVLESFIKKTDNYVLALGGGTPCYYDNFFENISLFNAFNLNSLCIISLNLGIIKI